MRYEVRYQIQGEERHTIVEADDAATAVERVQNDHLGSDQAFELLQVHLLDEPQELHRGTPPLEG
jgi:hypothetical protein